MIIINLKNGFTKACSIGYSSSTEIRYDWQRDDDQNWDGLRFRILV